MSAEDSRDESVELLQRLRPGLPVAELLGVFKGLGLRHVHVQRAVGVTPEALRLWARGGPVRQSNRVVIDNIARAIITLLPAARDPADIAQWLTAAGDSRAESPLQLIRTEADSVLAAAEAHAAGRFDEEQEFLRQAIESQRQAADLDDSDAPAEPTEGSSTQEKRLLLAHLHRNTAQHASAREVKDLLEARRESSHANYIAYGKLFDEVREVLKSAGDQPAQVAIARLLAETSAEEESLREGFERAGDDAVSHGNSILTYSLSMRVIHALWGVERAKQETCKLYVAEGRVKSLPRSGALPAFADAAEILRFLQSTHYDRYIVPDALASSIVAKGRVDLVMLGAQKVFRSDGEFTHFVATAGTDAILRAAQAGKVPVVVFAEEGKIVDDKPDVKPNERVVPVGLPSTPEGEPGGHGRLMMISAELCNVDPADPESVGCPSFVTLSKGQRGVPAPV